MESVEYLRQIINERSSNVAFVIGNGINRFNEEKRRSSWDELLYSLWKKYSGNNLSEIPKGISLTEFYDLLEMEASTKNNDINFQREFCSPLSTWKYREHHKTIVSRAMSLGIPILTTNFDSLLSRSLDLDFYRFKQEPFTDFYPWGCYYSNKKLESPTSGFGIWHINGMERYHRSIRLGLTHYMGSVERARKMIHAGDEENLFSGKNIRDWRGRYNWLHLIFNKSLFIFGLKLEESEVFLRWVLIERAKYFKYFPSKQKKAWYICTKNQPNSGKELFLSKLGFEYIVLENYKDIYQELWI